MQNCAYCQALIVHPAGPQNQFCCHSCELLSDWINQGRTPLSSEQLKSQKILDRWKPFTYEDLESQYNLSLASDKTKNFRFYIEGLQCSSCVHLLEDIPQFFPGVLKVQLNYGRRTLEIECIRELTLGHLCQAVETLGYTPHPMQSESDHERAQQSENRADLKRIGVAGAIAGNQMLFAIPLYAGLTGELATVFKWISFILFLPILFFSANVFYKKAWTSLLVRRVNVDMMIVVAVWAGFLSSTYSLILGGEDLYYDSTASFVFLILLTRYFLKAHQDKLYEKSISADLFLKDVYEIVGKPDEVGIIHIDQHKKVNYLNIKENDLFRVHRGQLIPCDSQLVSGTCELDLSFLTGEVYPQRRTKSDEIMAGSKLLSEEAIFRSTALAKESKLIKSLNKLDQQKTSSSQFQTLTDLVSHRLTLVVFTLAIGFFVLTFKFLGYEAFKRSLALIVIACPCAVAFGTPLAHSLGMRKAFKKGFFIKSENAFEKLNKVKKIIFDKTGTLTSPQLKLLQTVPSTIDENHKSIMLSLEKNSLHPVAVSLKQEWGAISLQPIQEVREIAGLGVEGHDQKHSYSLKKSEDSALSSALQVTYSVDGAPHAYLYFEESLKDEAPAIVNYFNRKRYEVYLLSGDIKQRAVNLAKKLLISPSHILFEQTPEQKKIFIQQQNPCLFVGDGLNDLPALSYAFVSFAIRGPFESTLQTCDVYAPQKNLNGVAELFEISKKVHKTVQTNLGFAILYNTVGGICALLGLINPLVAAILMPISSILITSHTAWRLK